MSRQPITPTDLAECAQILAWALTWGLLGAGLALYADNGRSLASFVLLVGSLTANVAHRVLRRVVDNARKETHR